MVCIPEKTRAPEAADRRFAVGLRSHDRGFHVYVPGFRYYSPSLGRWVNRDPIGEPGGVNLVAFCRGRPTCSVDALGMAPLPPVRAPLPPAGPPMLPPTPVPPLLPPGVPMLPPLAPLGLPDLIGIAGFSGSIAWYQPFPPPAVLGGAFVKVSCTVKKGSCCDNGIRRRYRKWACSFTVGLYVGTPGPRIRPTIPLVQNLAACPTSQGLACSGVITATLRGSVVNAQCSYSFAAGRWTCAGGFRPDPRDVATARVTFGGGGSCNRTTVY